MRVPSGTGIVGDELHGLATLLEIGCPLARLRVLILSAPEVERGVAQGAVGALDGLLDDDLIRGIDARCMRENDGAG